MQKAKHPPYATMMVRCTCGNHFLTRSTHIPPRTPSGEEHPVFRVEACNACHPFYTGKHRIMDTSGRVDRFNRRYGAEQKTADKE